VTTFDYYLLKRFLHVFVVGFISTFGLYVVIDGFSNVDGFQGKNQEASTSAVLAKMATHYAFQASPFFDLIGPILSVLAVIVVFALLLKHKEVYPVLSAGIPTTRLMVPFLVGVVAINGLLILNQEAVIPRIANHLQIDRGNDENTARNVEPTYDYKSKIFISGSQLFLEKQEMHGAHFVFNVPKIVRELTILQAERAVFRERKNGKPAGWLLTDAKPGFDKIKLTEEGKKYVLPGDNPQEVFVVTDISFEQLCNRQTSYRFLSTPDLIKRIQNPSFGNISVRGQTLHLHSRFTSPLMNIIAVILAVPFVARKESQNLILNMAVCFGVLLSFLVISQVFLYLGRTSLISPDVAVWSPIVLFGSLAAWCRDYVLT